MSQFSVAKVYEQEKHNESKHRKDMVSLINNYKHILTLNTMYRKFSKKSVKCQMIHNYTDDFTTLCDNISINDINTFIHTFSNYLLDVYDNTPCKNISTVLQMMFIGASIREIAAETKSSTRTVMQLLFVITNQMAVTFDLKFGDNKGDINAN